VKKRRTTNALLKYHIQNIDGCGAAAYHGAIPVDFLELDMDFWSLAWIAVAVVGLGAAATYLIAKWIPESFGELAAEHGRFVGLGEARRAVALQSRQRQREAMNAIRIAS
jgi:hypothetical protein